MYSLAMEFENKKRDFTAEKSSALEIHEKSIFHTEILIGGVEVIEKVFAEWTALCEEGASNEPFFRPEWFAAFVRNFEEKILLLTVRRGEKLRAVLPLVIKNGNLHGVPVKKLQAVFNPNSPRFDLIHGGDETEREQIVKALWKEVKKQAKWNVLEMRLVKKNSWLNDLLAFAESEDYLTGIWEMDGAPFVSLPQSDDKEKLIEQFFNALSKNRRQLLKKKLRYLEELGTVEFTVTRGYSAELMAKYFELESHGWKGRAGTAASADLKTARLHDDFARAVAEKNALFIHELKLDGKTIAVYISIMYGKQTIGWKMSYNEEYARFSPGNLLFREVLNECMRNGSIELDQLSPATYNKSLWASGEYDHQAFYIFRRGIFGYLLWKFKFSAIKSLRKYKKNSLKKLFGEKLKLFRKAVY
jgi:CelD/BcsL family acetyltransferase involved in cellulose biosynthesis